MIVSEDSVHPPLTMRLLGTCEVTVHGRPLPPLRYRKELWLLALLAMRHDREVGRDVLAALFWPDAEESQARYYLRRSLSNLRRALGSEVRRLLSPTPRTVRLDLSGADCDLLAFDAALAEAAASAAPEEPLEQVVKAPSAPSLRRWPTAATALPCSRSIKSCAACGTISTRHPLPEPKRSTKG